MFEKPDAGWSQLDLPNCNLNKYCRVSYLTDVPQEMFNWFIYIFNNPGCHHHIEFDAEGWDWMFTYESDGKIVLTAPKCEEDADALAGHDRDFLSEFMPYTIKEFALLWIENYIKYKDQWIHFDCLQPLQFIDDEGDYLNWKQEREEKLTQKYIKVLKLIKEYR